jgi:hypothetical protein
MRAGNVLAMSDAAEAGTAKQAAQSIASATSLLPMKNRSPPRTSTAELLARDPAIGLPTSRRTHDSFGRKFAD